MSLDLTRLGWGWLLLLAALWLYLPWTALRRRDWGIACLAVLPFLPVIDVWTERGFVLYNVYFGLLGGGRWWRSTY